MAVLRRAWKEVGTEGAPRLLTVVAPAGIGKSRLIRELVDEVQRSAPVLFSRCIPYGDGITYWPIRGLILAAAGIDEADAVEVARKRVSALLDREPDGPRLAELVSGAVGLSEVSAAQDELFWAIRRTLEAIAREPTLIVVEDLHWAEPTLLDLLQYIVDLASAPMFLVATGRPELIDMRPEWAAIGERASLLRLEALTGTESGEMVAAQPGGEAILAEVRERIFAAAEGNPLFIEEMVAVLREDGLLVPDNGGWRAADRAFDATEVPTSIRALLAARLDRLPKEQRTVAERASVVGRTFEAAAVSELAPASVRPELGRHLLALVRKELLRPDRSDLTPGDSFRFRHILIRDAAYEMLPKAERATLHERFAGWLEHAAGDRLKEYEEILAHHLEQAARYRRELLLDDAETEHIAMRAGQFLTASGQRALALNSLRASQGFFQRALALLPADSMQRVDALLGVATFAAESGAFAQMHERLDEAIALASRSGDARLRSRTALAAARIRDADPPGDWVKTTLDLIARIRPGAEASADVELQAMTWLLEAQVMFFDGQLGRAASAGMRARDLAEELAGPAIRMVDLDFVTLSVSRGPMPAVEGIQELEAYIEDPRIAESGRAAACAGLGLLHAMIGEFDAGRSSMRRATEIAQALGRDVMAVAGDAEGMGIIESFAGNLDAAEQAILIGYRELQRVGETNFRSTLAGMLALLVAERGRWDDAAAYAEDAAQAAMAEDVVSQVLLRRARARILAGQGNPGEAVRLAREAVDRADSTDQPILRGDALADLANVLWFAGKRAEAREALTSAIGLYEAKGSLVSVRQARELFAKFDSLG